MGLVVPGLTSGFEITAGEGMARVTLLEANIVLGGFGHCRDAILIIVWPAAMPAMNDTMRNRYC